MSEQQDRPNQNKSKTKQFQKKLKHKEERSKLKQEVSRGDDPQDSYGKFKGWEW